MRPTPDLSTYPAEPGTEPPLDERGVGELVGDVARDLSALMRQELELAKAEAKDEARKAGKAAGMFGGAGFAGYMAAFWTTVTIFAALALVIPTVLAALVTTALWGVLGAMLFLRGRREMRRMQGLPKTQQTLKEDAAWARHPTS